MRNGRRLLLLIAGLMVLCSSSFAWINGQQPVNASFGLMLSNTIATLSGGSVMLNLAFLNQISMAAILFVAGVIILIAAVLGSRLTGLFGFILTFIITAAWLIASSLDISALAANFTRLGTGTDLALIGTLLTLLSIILPKFRRSRTDC